MKPLLDKYLPLASSSSNSTNLTAERQKDHYSHFILRLAFSSTEDLRRRFSRAEAALFRLRFLSDDTKERQAFIQSLNLDWELIGDDEKLGLSEELRSAGSGSTKRIQDESYFKVDWERVPELVEGRRVLVRFGKAYVPGREQVSMVISEFSSRLDKALLVCDNAYSKLYIFPSLTYVC